jgi:hypothetical protein
MPKAITIPPALNTANIPPQGARVVVTAVKVLIDQHTQLGVTKHGVALTVNYNGTLFSQMFSLDKAEIAGSAGRVLNSVGVIDTEAKDFNTVIQKLVGKEFNVVSKGGKIYWNTL